MKTQKWHGVAELGGMTLMMPPGFVATGRSTQLATPSADTHGYVSGSHRFILVGSGPGPSNLTGEGAALTEMGECETVINGRRVGLISYTWTEEDDRMSPSGMAGPQYMAVARFYTSGSQREAYVAFKSNIQSDLNSNRQMFWTVSFNGAPVSASASPMPQEPKSVPALASAAAPAPDAPPCVPKPDPTLPTASAVVDSALVQMLVSGAGPMPKGFAVMALTFDGASLSGLDVAQSDLPDAAQKQIATLIASNLKPHDTKSPSAFMLRVELQEAGLHYAVQPACAR